MSSTSFHFPIQRTGLLLYTVKVQWLACLKERPERCIAVVVHKEILQPPQCSTVHWREVCVLSKTIPPEPEDWSVAVSYGLPPADRRQLEMQTYRPVYSNRFVQVCLCLWEPLEGITIKTSQAYVIWVKIHQEELLLLILVLFGFWGRAGSRHCKAHQIKLKWVQVHLSYFISQGTVLCPCRRQYSQGQQSVLSFFV